MKIGFVGLGKMGAQMVSRLLDGGHEVIVTDLSEVAVKEAVTKGAIEASSRVAMAEMKPEAIWLMIPSSAVDAELEAWAQIIETGNIIVDGGNSDWRETIQRAEKLATKGIELVDVGTSGGILGLENGFSMMVGGSKGAVATIMPAIMSLSRVDGYNHFGPTGSGHYIKMVHNAIEYGMMEAYAEGYHMISASHEFPEINLSEVAKVWEHGSIISSQLNSLVETILRDNPRLEGIDGYVEESGEAKWALASAAKQSLPLPVVQAAYDVRVASHNGVTNFGTKLLAAMRNAFGGHNINKH